jgi:hypothetical protein
VGLNVPQSLPQVANACTHLAVHTPHSLLVPGTSSCASDRVLHKCIQGKKQVWSLPGKHTLRMQQWKVTNYVIIDEGQEGDAASLPLSATTRTRERQ